MYKYIRWRGDEFDCIGFTAEGLWEAMSIESREIVGWWMLDLARATAGDNFLSLLHHLQNASKTTAGGTLLNI